LKNFIQLCAALTLSLSTAAHGFEVAEVTTTTGCALTVAAMRATSTYAWDGECVGGKAEGLGTFVQKLRADGDYPNLYYSTQTRHAGITYGYSTWNATRRDPYLDAPEQVAFYFDNARIAFTKGWGWSLEGLMVGGNSMALPRPAPPEPLPSMRIESPTGIVHLLATTCATDRVTPACKDVSDPYRTIYLIREFDFDGKVFKWRATTPCPDMFRIASCQPQLAQKSAPLRAEIVAFLARAKPSVDAWLATARASRPNASPLHAAAQLPPPLAEVPAVVATPGVVDAALPVFDTKVPFPSRLGSMQWLDANTLAITTSEDNTFWNVTTVAVDVATRSASVLLAQGFLNCASDGLVAMVKGSLARQYTGGAAKPDVPDPVNVFYRWNASTRRLESEEPASKPGWNWYICAQTRAEDIKRPSIGFYGHNIRYLKPRDGVLQWAAAVARDAVTPVFLAKPGSAPIPVDVDAGDIALVPPYLSFSDEYLLTAGRFVIRGGIDHNGKMVDQLPAITIARDGRVHRAMLPAALKSALDGLAKDGGDGDTRPTAAGLLVNYNSWPAQGGGLYVNHAGAVKRVWCIPAQHSSEPCSLEQLELSPDGCQIAFVEQRGGSKTVKIIRLCIPARGA
jgi:hypothetical protein